MTFWRIYYHIVWSTYNRSPLITNTIEPILYKYIKNKCDSLDCHLHAIGGIEDHIHFVVSIPPQLSISDFVRLIKGSSSRHINQSQIQPKLKFAWQREYGVFSLGSQQLERAVNYVNNQKQHHERGSNRTLSRARYYRSLVLIPQPPAADESRANVIKSTQVD